MAQPGTTESEQQRLQRNLSELLQELRVAQAGVQILFGFLLTVVFTAQYAHASPYQHGIHLIAVVFSASSTLCFTAPAAWHRLLFRHGRRREIIRAANGFALAGLISLAAAMTSTVLLIGDVVLGGWGGGALGAAAGLAFALSWFLAPLRARLAAARSGQPPEPL